MSQQQSQPQHDPTPHVQPLGEELAAKGPATAGNPSEGVSLAVQRMWEVVRKGADVIVTLRQENAQLHAQMAHLRQSETELQERVEEFLERISVLERRPVGTDPHTSIDRLEDKIQSLEAELTEAHARLAEHTDLSQQLLQLRTELEARTQLFQELQDNYDHRPVTASVAEEERDKLQAELDRSLAIIEKYRSAGLRHVEDPSGEDQLSMFMPVGEGANMTAPEIRALASRLESVAIQLDELAKLS